MNDRRTSNRRSILLTSALFLWTASNCHANACNVDVPAFRLSTVNTIEADAVLCFCSVEYGVRVLDSIYEGASKVEQDKVSEIAGVTSKTGFPLALRFSLASTELFPKIVPGGLYSNFGGAKLLCYRTSSRDASTPKVDSYTLDKEYDSETLIWPLVLAASGHSVPRVRTCWRVLEMIHESYRIFSRLSAPFLVTQAISSEAVDEEREAEEEMTKMQAQVSKKRLKVGRYGLAASKPLMVVRKRVGSGW